MARVRVVTLKPFRGQHLVEAELNITTGRWWWKSEHTKTLRLLTLDGVQWHYAPGEIHRGRLMPEMEDALHRALELFQASSPAQEV